MKYKTFSRSRSIKDIEGEVERIYRKITGSVEELGRRNYYLGQEGRVLRGHVRDYQGQNRVLKGFALMVFMLG